MAGIRCTRGDSDRKEGIGSGIDYSEYSTGRSPWPGTSKMGWQDDVQWRWHSWKLGGRGDLSLLGVAPTLF